ncbi:MAG: HAMP domain-containing sensor histidine kinase, partial [Pseudomonadota bacterium]
SAPELSQLCTETLAVAVISVDADGAVVDANRRAFAALSADPIGLLWSDLKAKWTAAQREQGVADAPCPFIECKPYADGSRFVVLLEHERQPHASDPLAGESASVLAHQLRTPLSAATLYLSRMAGTSSLSAQHKTWLQRSLEQLAAAERMVGNLLMFSRDSAFATETLTLADIVSGVESGCEALLRRAENTCSFTIVNGDLPVLGNQVALVSALSNIVTNACQHAPGSDVVVIAEQGANQRCLITVRDTGPGFSATIDPFASTPSDGPSVTGLGLSVARHVVEQHGGLLTATNHPDGGALIRVELPLARCAVDSVEVLI